MALTLLSLCCIQAGSSSWGSLRMSHTSSAAWVEALSGMIYFHHTFHLPKRQQGQEAQASPCWFFISAPALPSVLIPIFGIAQSCSCCWGELEPTPAHRFPHVFPGHFLWKMMLLVHSFSLSELCLCCVSDPKLTEASDKLCTDFMCTGLSSLWLIAR